jgi:hypothetical protein
MTIISIGGKTFFTSLDGELEASISHPHTVIQMDDSTIKDGHLTLTANPPPHNKYINCVKGTEDVFSVKTDGFVECEALLATTGIETQDNGAIVAKYSNDTGILRMGRQPTIGDQTVGLLDGIHHERMINSKLEFYRQQLHPSVPKIVINGTTDAGVDWFKITDSDLGHDVFAIHPDGTMQTQSWSSLDLKHPDVYSHSTAVQAGSLYIGKAKLSEESGQLIIKRLKAEPYIPKRLTEVPYSYNAQNINANTIRTVNDWVVLARSTAGLSEVESKAIRIRHIFPVANETDDFLTNVQGDPAIVNNTVYIDKDFVGTSNGSITKPYTSLNSAMTAKLVDAQIQTFIFQLSEGVYTESISKTMSSRTHHVVIQGAGQGRTIIQAGQDFAAGKDTSCIYMKKFKHVEIRDLTIRFALYGFYPREVDSAVMENCRVTNCGSDGTVANHDFSKTQAQQLAAWQSSSTTDGGCCRIRECDQVNVSNCLIDYNLRGLRLQNCGSANNVSQISNNKIYRNMESGIYLAATNYNNTDGCQNIMVSNNKIFESYNNGLLQIGGQNNQFIGNVVRRSASAGFQSWHSVNTSVINNYFYDCNVIAHNGIGNGGDARACICFEVNANSAIQSGYDHMAVIQGNSMIKCNLGNQVSSTAIDMNCIAHPASSNKIIVDTNTNDATINLKNPNNIPVIATVESSNVTSVVQLTDVSNAGSGIIISAAERTLVGTNQTNITTLQGQVVTNVTDCADVTNAGSGIIISATERTLLGTHETEITALQNAGSGGLTGDDTCTSSTSITKFQIENTGLNGQVEFLLADIDPTGDTNDHQYRYITQSNNLQLYAAFFQNHVNKTEALVQSIGQNGNIVFHGYGANTSANFNNTNFQVRGTARFHSTVQFDSEPTVNNNFNVGDANTSYKILLNGAELETGSSGPTSFFYSGHNASYTLTADHKDVMWTRHLTQNQEGGAITFVLPATPADGSDLHINIHSFQNHVTLDQVGGTIYLQKDNSHTFSPLSHDDPIVKTYTWNKIYLTATDRSSFSATLDGATGVWYVKAYADRRKIHHNTFTKHFDKLVNTYNTEATAFQLPKGYQRYELSIGDGTAQDANTDFHAYFKPPETANLGTRIECLQLHPSHLNSCGGLYVVNVANHDHILPGGTTATSPAYLSQSSSGRKRHVLIKTGATRWTQHRTM